MSQNRANTTLILQIEQYKPYSMTTNGKKPNKHTHNGKKQRTNKQTKNNNKRKKKKRVERSCDVVLNLANMG